MPDNYALFVFDAIMNTTTFAYMHSSKEAILISASKNFKDHVWFAVYKFSENTTLFSRQIPASKWFLDTKKAQPSATKYSSSYTPMECAYQIDGGYEWFFKSF